MTTALGERDVQHDDRIDRKRLLVMCLFMLPVGYCGVLLGVTIHEVVGHGCTALLVGGEFHGFTIKWDAMGWARTSQAPGAPTWHRALVLVGGSLSTTIAAFLVLIVARRCGSLTTRLLLAMFATTMILDGGPYTFWSALHPGTGGDAARVVTLLDSSLTQPILVLTGAFFALVGHFLFPAMVLSDLEHHLLDGRASTRRTRALVVGLFFLLPAAVADYFFDWNQLIEGIGFLPSHVNAALTVGIALVFLKWLPRVPEHSRPGLPLGRMAAAAWGVALMLVFAVFMWFSDGIYW